MNKESSEEEKYIKKEIEKRLCKALFIICVILFLLSKTKLLCGHLKVVEDTRVAQSILQRKYLEEIEKRDKLSDLLVGERYA